MRVFLVVIVLLLVVGCVSQSQEPVRGYTLELTVFGEGNSVEIHTEAVVDKVESTGFDGSADFAADIPINLRLIPQVPLMDLE